MGWIRRTANSNCSDLFSKRNSFALAGLFVGSSGVDNFAVAWYNGDIGSFLMQYFNKEGKMMKKEKSAKKTGKTKARVRAEEIAQNLRDVILDGKNALRKRTIPILGGLREIVRLGELEALGQVFEALTRQGIKFDTQEAWDLADFMAYEIEGDFMSLARTKISLERLNLSTEFLNWNKLRIYGEYDDVDVSELANMQCELNNRGCLCRRWFAIRICLGALISRWQS
ncbi:MAG: hypothetical protein Q4B29_01265 [Candidatus Saccharibacteria bacterium]|nr:hypothetical protein [Candidatus Saccharibacteria bacterium]